jgi:hypothetical protein
MCNNNIKSCTHLLYTFGSPPQQATARVRLTASSLIDIIDQVLLELGQTLDMHHSFPSGNVFSIDEDSPSQQIQMGVDSSMEDDDDQNYEANHDDD